MASSKHNKEFWSGRDVLCTGGAGMIGSHLVEKLVELDARVTVADSLIRGKLGFLNNVKSKIRFDKANLHFLPGCISAVEGQNVIFNLAARVTGIGFNIKHQSIMFEKNLPLQMWPLIAAAHCESVERFIQVSTACVYPSDAPYPTPESVLDWGRDPAIRGPEDTNRGYGWAKRMGEFLGTELHLAKRLKVWIVRPSNCYGPRDDFNLETCHVIPALIVRCMLGEDPLVVWGSGNQQRVFIYVKDLVDGMISLAEKEPTGVPVNIGSEDEISIKDLAKKIVDLCDQKVDIKFKTDMPDGYARRLPDLSRLREYVNNWLPETSLDEGLKETIRYYQRYISHRVTDRHMFDNRPEGQ